MALCIKPDFEGERTDEEGGRYLLAVYKYRDVAAYFSHLGLPAPELFQDGYELADALGHDAEGWRACQPGQSFSHGAYASQCRKRIVVRQTIAFDI